LINYLDKSCPEYGGLGSELKSNYPPLYLDFQIGGAALSGRFVVSDELKSSPVLIGTDIIHSYNIYTVLVRPNVWECRIGFENKILCAVPCRVLFKNAATNKLSCKRIDMSSAMDDELIEPGFEFKIGQEKKETDVSEQLQFIKNNSDIPEKYKQPLMDSLKAIPELYSGKDFSEKPFPEDIFCHDIEFLDEANTQELYTRPYPISGIRAEQLKATIEEMVEQDILEPGDSPFVSPVFYVLKKVNRDATAAEGRLVFDYRKLNSLIRPFNHPITNIKDFFNQASKFKVFTLVDLKNAFLSVKMTKRASERAAIITPFGVFKPKRSPFGLKTSPSAFCYAPNHVLKDLPFVVWYMDDIVIILLLYVY
jgi:Reverse transcriptase (RNA-dependent DNA polymerase)